MKVLRYIVFIHTFPNSICDKTCYLNRAIRLCRKNNPELSINLITNLKNVDLNDWPCQIHDISNFMENVHEFREIYQHRSVNQLVYERFCFERFLILKNFCKLLDTSEIDRIAYVDSDIFMFKSLKCVCPDNIDADLCLLDERYSGFPFMVRSSIDKFVEFLFKIYKNGNFDEFVSKWGEKAFSKPHFSDMYAMHAFVAENKCSVEILNFNKNRKHIIQSTFNLTSEQLISNTAKELLCTRLKWTKEGIPVVDGNEQEFFHFQGKTKVLCEFIYQSFLGACQS